MQSIRTLRTALTSILPRKDGRLIKPVPKSAPRTATRFSRRTIDISRTTGMSAEAFILKLDRAGYFREDHPLPIAAAARRAKKQPLPAKNLAQILDTPIDPATCVARDRNELSRLRANHASGQEIWIERLPAFFEVMADRLHARGYRDQARLAADTAFDAHQLRSRTASPGLAKPIPCDMRPEK